MCNSRNNFFFEKKNKSPRTFCSSEILCSWQKNLWNSRFSTPEPLKPLTSTLCSIHFPLHPCIKFQDFSKWGCGGLAELTTMLSGLWHLKCLFFLLSDARHEVWHCPVLNQLVNLINSCHLSIEWGENVNK